MHFKNSGSEQGNFYYGTENPYHFVLHILCYDAKVHKVEISLAF